MSVARRLIVNADDFGISRGVNRGVVDAHRRGIVTSASLMPNLDAAEDALTRAATCPELQLGLHLTLTAGRPLSPPERIPSLVDSHGRLPFLGELLARLALGLVRRSDLVRELTSQVEWSLKRGLRPDHVDSHHHIHVHPLVSDIVLGLIQQHRVPFVRCPIEGYFLEPILERRPIDATRIVAISIFGRLFQQRARRFRVRTTDHFRGISIGTGFSAPKLAGLLRRLPPGLTELMTHPGYPDDELRHLTVFVEGRERELAALTSAEIGSSVQRARTRLTTFRSEAERTPYT